MVSSSSITRTCLPARSNSAVRSITPVSESTRSVNASGDVFPGVARRITGMRERADFSQAPRREGPRLTSGCVAVVERTAHFLPRPFQCFDYIHLFETSQQVSPASLRLLLAESRRSTQSTAGKALAILSPHAQWAVRGGSDKVVVGRQQRQSVTDAELREQSVDGADLHTGATAAITQFRGVNMILPVRGEERQGREPVDDVFTRTRTCEPLQQFLQNQSRRHKNTSGFSATINRCHSRRSAVFATVSAR